MEEVLRLIRENRELKERVEILEKCLRVGDHLLEKAQEQIHKQQAITKRFQELARELIPKTSPKDDEKPPSE